VLTFEPGGFIYRGHRQPLKGKPLQVLQAFAEAPGRICTAAALLRAVWPDVAVEEDTLRSAVCDARKALRQVLEAAGVEGPADPIPTVDRGMGRLAWQLDLP
jgi:DNA-binding winged helix-turn-helix (wHTH) protein